MTAGRDLVESLSATIDRTLQDILSTDQPCALVDFPEHANVGDNAIWLGERACLQRLGLSVAYTCSISSYAAKDLARQVGDGPILLSGGGNFGDLYPVFQLFREQLLDAFPDNPVVQLPQSICFHDERNLRLARSCLERHARFTLMVRDRHSLKLARKHFAVPCVLCPDMAFALGCLARSAEPSTDVLWLARDDQESLQQPVPVADAVLSTDWGTSAWPPYADFDQRAAWQLARGCRLLSQGRVVITDRLHGHIIALLLGIFHVAMDNTYGKVRSCYETWTSGCPLGLWSSSPAEALWKARELLSWQAQRQSAAAR